MIPRRSCVIALLAVIVSVKSEKCNSVLDGDLLIGEEDTIWRVNPREHNVSRNVYTWAASPISLAYSYSRQTLYYSDLDARQVFALRDNSTSEHQVVVAGNPDEWLPWGIAVDDLNDKLYVVESSASALHVYDLNSGDATVVIGTNITQPKDVEIDADEGHLFVLDKHQILRAELDGSNPTAIYEELTTIDQMLSEYPKDLAEAIIGSFPQVAAADRKKVFRKSISIADLTLDLQSKRIYWVDTLKRTVQSSDYDGNNRKVHFRDRDVTGNFESLASVAFSNGVVYWADDVAKKLYRIDADGAAECRVILNDLEAHTIAAVACEKQPKARDNPCAGNTCEQLCLLSKSARTGYRCACKVGLELAHDGKTCRSVQDFILFTQDNYLRGQSLTAGGNRKDVIEPSRFFVGKASTIDFDARSGIVYYSSGFPDDQLHEIRLNDSRTRILRPDLLSNNTGALAYDWTTKNLYYFTYYYADATTLSVANVEDPTYSKVLIKNVPRLTRGLAVHPNKGYLFFARLDDDYEQQRRGSISRSATDGSALKVIVDLGPVESVDALAVDFEEDRIYWTEITTSGEYVARHANLDGQDVRKLSLPDKSNDVTKLAIQGKYIYAINDGKSLFRVDKNGENPVAIVTDREVDSLSDLKVFSRSLQTTRPDHPCNGSHAGCRKFCFAVPVESNGLKATCGCRYGEKLAEDAVSCVDNSEIEPAFLPCKHTSFRCNMQTAA